MLIAMTECFSENWLGLVFGSLCPNEFTLPVLNISIAALAHISGRRSALVIVNGGGNFSKLPCAVTWLQVNTNDEYNICCISIFLSFLPCKKNISSLPSRR